MNSAERWIIGLFLAVVFGSAGHAAAQRTDDGLRKIDAPRFGVAVRAPVAWSLVQWSEDDKAFVLSLPQERGSPAGYVTCELSLPPETLLDYQRRNQAENERARQEAHARRMLLTNTLEKIAVSAGKNDAQATAGLLPDAKDRSDAGRGKECLVTVWELDGLHGPKRFEVSLRLIRHEMLYTFTLLTDEAHFAAYRADFDELLASAKFSPPETGLQAIAGGYWLQRQFRFALRLPAAWKPAFGSSDKALLFARGATHGLFSDHLMVLASPAKPLNFAALMESVPDSVLLADPVAQVESCKVVRQGAGRALETVIQTRRGDVPVTLLTRRFMGERQNYEVRVTCLSESFEEQAADVRRALDSFREIAEPVPAQAS